MIFNNLSQEIKQALHEELLSYAMSVGGKNFFLQMIEDIKEEKPNPLLNKTATFHYSNGTINWGKSIYKDTLTSLFNAMKKEEKDGDMIDGLKPKEYKSTMNMMRALKPVQINIVPNDSIEDANGFSLSILDATQEKKTKVSLIFKIIFFYNINFAKDVLNYKPKEN